MLSAGHTRLTGPQRGPCRSLRGSCTEPDPSLRARARLSLSLSLSDSLFSPCLPSPSLSLRPCFDEHGTREPQQHPERLSQAAFRFCRRRVFTGYYSYRYQIGPCSTSNLFTVAFKDDTADSRGSSGASEHRETEGEAEKNSERETQERERERRKRERETEKERKERALHRGSGGS